MPLKSRSTLPPGGWIYQQRDNTGKVIKTFKSMSPFRDAVQEILKCRVANHFDRATNEEVADDLDQSTCERIGFDARFCLKKNSTEPFHYSPAKLFQAAATHLRQSVQAVQKRSQQAATGLQILKDWLGDDAKPVPAEQSQARADVCTNCKFNVSGFKPVAAIAEVILSQVEKKNEMKLSVVGEENLNTCHHCWCYLRLKVHVPMRFIKECTPDAMFQKIRDAAPYCWMITENEVDQVGK